MHMKKLDTKTVIGTAAGLAVIALFFWYGAPGTQQAQQEQERLAAPSEEQVASIRAAFEGISPEDADYVELLPGLKMFEFTAGTGVEVLKDKSVAIHYVARFENGVQFDSSVERNQPLLFVYGQSQLIPGIEAGLAGARVGSIRRIIVPAELGYGKAGVVLEDGTVVIPPDAALEFDVAVVGVEE